MATQWGVRDLSILVVWMLLQTMGEGEESDPPKQSDTICAFQNKRYRLGERWHPYLEPYGYVYCISCLCSESGSVLCNRIRCPPLTCASPVKVPQQCCHRCPEFSPPPPLDWIGGKPCQYDGTQYQHGDVFVVEGLFPSRHANQCSQCSCSEGSVYCRLRTCPKLTCLSPVSVPESCCRVCKESGDGDAPWDQADGESSRQPANREARHSYQRSQYELLPARSLAALSPHPSFRAHRRLSADQNRGPGTTVQIIIEQREQNSWVCVSNGKTYSHGESWHPVLRSFGVMECILCTCNVTRQECKKIRCPEPYPCQHPQKVAGKCCKVCQAEEPSLKDEGSREYFCGEQTWMVYETLLSGEEFSIRTIVLETEPPAEAELHIWTIVKGLLRNFQIKKVPMQDLHKHGEFKPLTRTTQSRWKIFREGEFQISQMCAVQTCLMELEDLVRVLFLDRPEKSHC